MPFETALIKSYIKDRCESMQLNCFFASFLLVLEIFDRSYELTMSEVITV